MSVSDGDIHMTGEASKIIDAAKEAVAAADAVTGGVSDSGNSSGVSNNSVITVSDDSHNESISSTEASGNVTNPGDVTNIVDDDSMDTSDIDKLFETVSIIDVNRRKNFPVGHVPVGIMDQDKVIFRLCHYNLRNNVYQCIHSVTYVL